MTLAFTASTGCGVRSSTHWHLRRLLWRARELLVLGLVLGVAWMQGQAQVCAESKIAYEATSQVGFSSEQTSDLSAGVDVLLPLLGNATCEAAINVTWSSVAPVIQPNTGLKFVRCEVDGLHNGSAGASTTDVNFTVSVRTNAGLANELEDKTSTARQVSWAIGDAMTDALSSGTLETLTLNAFILLAEGSSVSGEFSASSFSGSYSFDSVQNISQRAQLHDVSDNVLDSGNAYLSTMTNFVAAIFGPTLVGLLLCEFSLRYFVGETSCSGSRRDNSGQRTRHGGGGTVVAGVHSLTEDDRASGGSMSFVQRARRQRQRVVERVRQVVSSNGVAESGNVGSGSGTYNSGGDYEIQAAQRQGRV